MQKTKRALVSVSNKEGLIELVKVLVKFNYEIISTGGTKTVLSKAGIATTDISAVTGNPEAFHGRMKTMSFNIGAALLFDREVDAFEAAKLGVQPIDMVVCNFYPFALTAAKGATLPELIENIDIGGPCMVRAAAKNYKWVSVITSPETYPNIISELESYNGVIGEDTRLKLMQQAFAMSAEYDAFICNTLFQMAKPSAAELPTQINLGYTKQNTLRYGENPHQKASIYLQNGSEFPYKVLGGVELSYNNIVDMYSAFDLVQEFTTPACVIVKHSNPCGVATQCESKHLLSMAWSGDTISSFGSVIAFNKQVEKEYLEFLNLAAEKKSERKFVELVCAPSFSHDAIAYLQLNEKLRIVVLTPPAFQQKHKILGNILLSQDSDATLAATSQCVTLAPFAPLPLELLDFGLKIVKNIKSNAIAIVEKTPQGCVRLLGMGAGQPNRLESTRLALNKACANLASEGDTPQQIREKLGSALLVSDAFFPFPDSIEEAIQMGICFIAQPGGSIKDKLAIECCNSHAVSMLFTGIRHFNH